MNLSKQYHSFVLLVSTLASFSSFGLTGTRGYEGTLSTLDGIVGSDERVQVTDTTTYPYRTIGRIAIGCTGTLIGPRHVLTAGHCVYDTDIDKWSTKLDFSPAQNGTKFPYGTIKYDKAFATTGYTSEHKKQSDFAVITLKEEVGNTLGYLGYGYADENETPSITITGYPGDKPKTVWQSFCDASFLPQMFKYTCDTYPGMSGSAIHVANGKDRFIIGVHTLGLGTYNSGVELTKEDFEQIESWVRDNP